MFNDEDVIKSATKDVLYAFGFIAAVVILVVVLCFTFDVSNSANTEVAQSEPLPTAEYEKNDGSNNLVASEPVFETIFEMNDNCEHNWVISEEHSTLIRNVKLAYVASEGIEKVYLTRHRDAFNQTISDIYIAYDENLKDITLYHLDGVFKIEYFPAGVGMGTPRLEEYEITMYACENCNEFKCVPGEKQTIYKFYIPEGTYLISH